MMRTMSAAGPCRVTTAFLLLAATALTLGVGSTAAAPLRSPWGASYFPNIPLINQDGKTLHFYDDVIKGKVVAINFIYTSCHDSCPLETAKLRQVQQVLGDRVGRDIFMYSISIDPEHDTPAVLKKYMEKFKIGPGWQFLTGNKEDITLLRKRLGMYRQEGEVENLSDHNVSLIVGNEATGQWIKRSPFDNPKVLASMLANTLHNYRAPVAGAKSYAQAPRLPKLSRAEYLFRTRCQSCHTVGAGDAVGPDLLGVVDRRDRAWLARWLKLPDQMLAEKDPIAMELYAKYKELAMPNLKLSDVDANALIEYLETESRRVERAKRSGGQDAAGTSAGHG